MSPSADPIAEIKTRLDIVDVIGQKVQLKKAGHTFKGLCPFHSEKSPSFVVFPDKGNYHCFGCGANGDVFSFVMKTDNLDFAETLRELARRTGVELKPRLSGEGGQSRRARLLELVEQAAMYFQQSLRRPDASEARDYLAGRGISAATIDTFRIGWAPDRWDGLCLHLEAKGAKPDELVAAGLARERDGGGIYDCFRGRVMFPIGNDRGELVGFGGRILDDGQPKYLNSPQTELFDKGATLFGIDQARAAIRTLNRATLVEGYVDVLIAHQCGIKDVIASLGTALTERQVSALKRLTRTVVLALDSDAAGDDAVLRGLDVARQVFADERVPVPLPQGLVRLESRLGADIFIASLPRGRDPDEIIRESPDRWREIVDAAQPIVDYYFDVVLGRSDLSSTKGKTAAIRQLLPIVGEVRDPVQQALYLQRLADRVKIAEQLLASELARQRLTAKAPEKVGDRRDPENPRRRSTLDEYAIGLLLAYPAQARDFANALEEDDLELVESQEIVTAIRRLVQGGSQPERQALVSRLPEPLAEWLEAVLRDQEGRPILDEREVTREQEKCLRELRRRADRKRIATYSAFLRELEAEESSDASEMYRRVEQALARLQTAERMSPQARVWSNLS